MSPGSERFLRDIDDVVETLSNAKRRGTKCSVLIGAGCSTPEIPTAQGFVEAIKEKYPTKYNRADPKTYLGCMSELSISEQRALIAEFVDQSKINWGHIALAQLIEKGFVDRVLTTNFDSLVVRACALLGIFPAVYDFASSQNFEADKVPGRAIFYLHGQRTGFVLMNEEKVLEKQSQLLAPVFTDAGLGRVWMVVGYSGENDPVFNHLAQVKRFDNNLYWVGYRDNDPSPHVRDKLLSGEKDAFYVKGFDSDGFFVELAKRLGCFPPDFVGKPFTHLKTLYDDIKPYSFSKNERLDPMHFARTSVHQAYEMIEVDQSDVFQAWSDLLGGQHEKVIDLRSKYGKTMNSGVQDVVAWAYIMQGNHLLDQANAISGAESDEFYKHTGEKYAEAVKIKPTMHEAFYNWGIALFNWARRKEGAEADELFIQAGEKSSEAVKIKPDYRDALYNLGLVLHSRARLKQGAEADELFKQASETFAKVVGISPKDHDALDRWGQSLLNLFEISPVEKKKDLFDQAKNTLLKAETIQEGSGSYNLACLYALNNEVEESRKWLLMGKEKGKLPDRKHVEEDADLNNVRDQQWFKDFLASLP